MLLLEGIDFEFLNKNNQLNCKFVSVILKILVRLFICLYRALLTAFNSFWHFAGDYK